MHNIQFLTMPGCHSCEAVKKIFSEIMSDFPNIKVKEIDMTTDEGQKLVQQYSVMASPGIIIDNELFATGGVDKKSLVDKLKSLK